jgi:hypothetical protein
MRPRPRALAEELKVVRMQHRAGALLGDNL